MKKEKKNTDKKQLIIIFSVTTTVLLCMIAVMGVGLYKLSRINMFSTNISLDNNYFIADIYSEKTGNQYTESFSCVDGVETEESIEDTEYRNYFYYELEKFYNYGIITSSQYNELINISEIEGVDVAAQHANELIGSKHFIVQTNEHIIDVPYISQVGILPNGCEAVSATMLLHYNNFNIEPVDFVDKYLEQGEVYVKWGCRYGPNPKIQYAGDPKSKKGGWGCFAPVIIKALNKYLDGKMYAKNLTGLTLDEIVQQYISADIPVAVWVTQNMEKITSLYQWQSYDKSETFLYPVREHCMVLTGFDDEYYYFNDPLNEAQAVKFKKEVASASYNSLGKQAVAIINAQ